MRPLTLGRAFFGAFFGVIFYKIIIGQVEVFENYWANFVADALIMGLFIFACFALVDWVTKVYSSIRNNEHA